MPDLYSNGGVRRCLIPTMRAVQCHSAADDHHGNAEPVNLCGVLGFDDCSHCRKALAPLTVADTNYPGLNAVMIEED
jgi:hypothetical protein